MVYMDENGDAEGNYTLIALDDRPARGHGLYPIAHFVGKEQGTNLPVSTTLLSRREFSPVCMPEKEGNITEKYIRKFNRCRTRQSCRSTAAILIRGRRVNYSRSDFRYLSETSINQADIVAGGWTAGRGTLLRIPWRKMQLWVKDIHGHIFTHNHKFPPSFRYSLLSSGFYERTAVLISMPWRLTHFGVVDTFHKYVLRTRHALLVHC